MFDPIGWFLSQGGGMLLVLARVAGLTCAAPAWGTPGLDWRVRVGLAGTLGMVVYPVVGPGLIVPGDSAALGRTGAAEFLVGASLGLVAALIVAAARQAGDLVGLQAGLAPAAILDPDAGDGMNPVGHLYGLVALGTFLALDGPLILIGVLAESYQAWPLGGPSLSSETVTQAFGLVGSALELALRIAAPVALALMLAGLAVGLLGRAAPALHALTLALPLRTVIGLSLVVIGLAALVATLVHAWEGLAERVLRLGAELTTGMP
jgi:flagellar biosynthetic protein FliR